MKVHVASNAIFRRPSVLLMKTMVITAISLASIRENTTLKALSTIGQQSTPDKPESRGEARDECYNPDIAPQESASGCLMADPVTLGGLFAVKT